MTQRLIIINYIDHRHISGIATRSKLISEWFYDRFESVVEVPLRKINKEIVRNPSPYVELKKNVLWHKGEFANFFRTSAKNKMAKYIGKGNVLLIFGPRTQYVPKSSLEQNHVIVAQSNRYDTNFSGWMKTEKINELRDKAQHINQFVFYTETDKRKFIHLFEQNDIPFEHMTLSVIANPSRLPRKNIAQRNHKLIYIGRLYDSQKNLVALKTIMSLLPEFTLDVYGSGQDEKILKGVENISLHGATDNITEAYHGKSITVLTSNYEGFGNSVIEGLSCGLPVVAFNNYPAINEIVVDHVNGRLIQHNNHVDFANAVRSITKTVESYSSYSSSAFKSSAKYECEVIKNKWDVLFSRSRELSVNRY